ncbi:hypothetical protein HDU80_005970 [Chytriomyces hyalinus]|nr:hypothetical protein HDU80_005970 [Chytriomyces hyalinus]
MAAGDPGPLQRLIQKELLGTDSFPLRLCVDAVAIMSMKSLTVEQVSLVAATVVVALRKLRLPLLPMHQSNRALTIGLPMLGNVCQMQQIRILLTSLLMYDILNDPSHPSNYDADTQFQSVLRILEQEGPDLIALQEVNSTFLKLALKDTSSQSDDFISAVTMDQVPTNLLLLSKYPFSDQIV